jgi:hypothetical protein
MSTLLNNLKDWKTTLPALLLFLIALPNADWVSKVLGFLPATTQAKLVTWIAGLAAIASGIGLIFGIKAQVKK